VAFRNIPLSEYFLGQPLMCPNESKPTFRELKPMLRAAVKVARAAGKILKSKASLKRRVTYKGKVNLVTEVDTLSEATIVGYLSTMFPDHSFLAEEGGASKAGSEFQWVVDPLDGTTNYVHGYPIYSVSIALRYLDSTVLGVVYDPNLDELFGAIEGHGAYLNGTGIRVSTTASLSHSLLATGFPYDVRESKNNNLDHFSNFAVRAQAVRRGGSAALDLCQVACGRLDGFWELKLGPWDTAAGALVVKEAGGKVTDFSGNGFDIFKKEITASNGRIHREMLRTLALSLHHARRAKNGSRRERSQNLAARLSRSHSRGKGRRH
jgi:myo-inositol-1(or 4)-monophosphatase